MRFGNMNIRSRRQQMGLSQEELAVRAGVAKRTVQFAESATGRATPKTLRAIADALNWEYDELVGAPQADVEDAFTDGPVGIYKMIQRKIRPSSRCFCRSADEARVAIALMRENWHAHLLRSGRQLTDRSFAVADRILNERYAAYQDRYLDIWECNPETLRFAIDGDVQTGVSVVLPVTDEAYDRLWQGEIDYFQIGAEDILPTSQNLVIDSAVEFAANPRLPWFKVTETLSFAVFAQLASLSIDPRGDDFRMISFGASDANIRRLKANGFVANGIDMPTFNFPLFQFAMNNFDLSEDRYEQTSTAAHMLHLLKRRIGSHQATRLRREMFTHALKAYQTASDH